MSIYMFGAMNLLQREIVSADPTIQHTQYTSYKIMTSTREKG